KMTMCTDPDGSMCFWRACNYLTSITQRSTITKTNTSFPCTTRSHRKFLSAPLVIGEPSLPQHTPLLFVGRHCKKTWPYTESILKEEKLTKITRNFPFPPNGARPLSPRFPAGRPMPKSNLLPPASIGKRSSKTGIFYAIAQYNPAKNTDVGKKCHARAWFKHRVGSFCQCGHSAAVHTGAHCHAAIDCVAFGRAARQ